MGVPGAAEPAASVEVSPRRLVAEALVETTCFLRGLPPPPASGRVERSAVTEGNEYSWGAERRRDTSPGLLESFGGVGSVWGCWIRSGVPVPWRSLRFGPHGALRSRRREGRREMPPPAATGRIERSAGCVARTDQSEVMLLAGRVLAGVSADGGLFVAGLVRGPSGRRTSADPTRTCRGAVERASDGRSRGGAGLPVAV